MTALVAILIVTGSAIMQVGSIWSS